MSKTESYDYVIVGAGSAGCVLANRLSADPDVTVCLIEAGKPDNSLLVRMPAGVGNLLKYDNALNWGFWTVPQTHMNGRKLYWPRGRVLGGSSSINGMIYIRGHARDYDQWRQSGLTGWGYGDVLPYFRRSESFEHGENAYHGGNGPLNVSESPMDNPVFERFVEAGQQAGFSVTDDFNGAQQEGFGRYQRTIHKGERWSASFAYLHPVMKHRKNLTVKSTALVSRVVFRGGTAHGVELVPRRGAEPELIYCSGEVIVSAGAVQSPQVLMLSGIGPADAIRRHGITPIADVAGVGQHMQDHLDVTIVNTLKEKISAYSAQAGLKKLTVALRYLMSKSGPGSDNFLQAGAFLKSREGLDRPDVQLHLLNAMMFDHGNTASEGDGFTVHACQLRPESRGTIGLASADPFDAPLIDPNYLATEEDRRVMRDSVKMCRDICAQPALAELIGEEVLPGLEVGSDDAIDAFVRARGETIYHPVGTVHMGIREDAPLDPELRVRGVDGLRVVDASVMPTLIGGNTNAPTIMIAEKASDMIRGIAPPHPDEVEVAA